MRLLLSAAVTVSVFLMVSAAGYIRATQKGRDNPVITDKLVNALYFRGTQDFDRKIVREAVKKQFGVPAEQKIPRRVRYSGSMTAKEPTRKIMTGFPIPTMSRRAIRS